MTIHFRPAAASEAKPLIGLYAESGTGKTKSALLLAKGFAGDMTKVGMIETESGRGEAYARDPVVGGYQVLPLREDFSPKAYGAAIVAAEKAGLQVLIIDSASHEWEGVGGVLDQAAKNQDAGKKGPVVWQKPKIDHKREFMLRLMQTPIPLVIVCMRAKYPMKEATAEDVERVRAAGKKPPQKGDWFRSDRLDPTQADDILFEMFVHGWIDHDHRFHLTKSTVDELRSVFAEGERITVSTGERLKDWAFDRSSDKPVGASASRGSPQPAVEEALLIKAREFAECGTDRYAEWWNSITPEQRRAIGTERHEQLKATASRVPA